MINNLFYSNRNKDAIKYILKEKENIVISGNTELMMNDTMEYVYSQVSPNPPKGVASEEYLFLMNKKVYELMIPFLKNSGIQSNNLKNNIQSNDQNNIKNNNQNIKQNIIKNKKSVNFIENNNNNNNFIQNNLFDPLIIKKFENPSIMEYPQPSLNKQNGENIDTKIKNLENERSVLTPKIRPVDFTLKTDDSNKPNTTQLFNDLLSNMNNFENEQKNINKKIENIEANELLFYNQNNTSFTPIDLLKNKNETLSFFETSNDSKSTILKDLSNNVAYNRNDIETFINNNDRENSFNTGMEFNNLSQNNDLEFGDVNSNFKNVMLDEPKFKLIEKNFNVIFDSSDRDLYEYPNQNDFQVKFSPAGNNYRYENYYDKYGTLILMEKIVVYGDGSNVSVNETFDNINSVACNSANVPLNIIYIGSNENNIGTPINVFKEPYLYLVIPELRGPYRGGNLFAYNSFAKMIMDYSSNINTSGIDVKSNYTTLSTSAENEFFLYEPVSGGKIDKMTLKLLNKNGVPFNFGIDKLFVEGFKKGNLSYNSYCGEKYETTIITIQNINDEYIKYCSIYYKAGPCNFLNSHPVQSGDLLYFYNTIPQNDQVVFLEDYIYISNTKINKNNNNITFYFSYKKIIDNEEKTVSVNLGDLINDKINIEKNYFAVNGYYLVLFNNKTNKYYYFKILFLDENSVICYNLENLYNFKDYTYIKIGIAKNNLRGSNNEDSLSFFNKSGYRVIKVGTTENNKWEIETDFPYNNLPANLKENSVYYPGDIFFIQEKMQISYTFTITIKTKNYLTLNSLLNESGNN